MDSISFVTDFMTDNILLENYRITQNYFLLVSK